MDIDLTIVSDGRQAVDSALQQPFDLILMDMQMPNLSGYDATKTLRQQGLTTPIIAITANVMDGDREQCLAAGCSDYIPKPIHHHSFLTMLQQYLTQPQDSKHQDFNVATSTKGKPHR